jgi:hypothetical protein
MSCFERVQAACAAARSRARSSLSHVKPWPITRNVRPGTDSANMRSPVFLAVAFDA